jgi:hypothetical protein
MQTTLARWLIGTPRKTAGHTRALSAKHRNSKSQHKICYEWFEKAFLSWADTAEWVKIADEGDSPEAQSITAGLEEIAKAIDRNQRLIARHDKIVSDPDDASYEEIMPKNCATIQGRKILIAQRESLDSKLSGVQFSTSLTERGRNPKDHRQAEPI